MADASSDPVLPGYHDATTPSAARPPLSPQTISTSKAPALDTEHHYSLETSNHKAWVTLAVKSRASSANSLPLFVDGDDIAGVVTFDLKKAESVKGVTLSVSYERSGNVLQDLITSRFIHRSRRARLPLAKRRSVSLILWRNFPRPRNSKGCIPSPSKSPSRRNVRRTERANLGHSHQRCQSALVQRTSITK
jgi:hypothetical protein